MAVVTLHAPTVPVSSGSASRCGPVSGQASRRKNCAQESPSGSSCLRRKRSMRRCSAGAPTTGSSVFIRTGSVGSDARRRRQCDPATHRGRVISGQRRCRATPRITRRSSCWPPANGSPFEGLTRRAGDSVEKTILAGVPATSLLRRAREARHVPSRPDRSALSGDEGKRQRAHRESAVPRSRRRTPAPPRARPAPRGRVFRPRGPGGGAVWAGAAPTGVPAGIPVKLPQGLMGPFSLPTCETIQDSSRAAASREGCASGAYRANAPEYAFGRGGA